VVGRGGVIVWGGMVVVTFGSVAAESAADKLPSSAEVKNASIFTSTPLEVVLKSQGQQCLFIYI
jgi:uncharacterized protein YccT (UPF0319 family)